MNRFAKMAFFFLFMGGLAILAGEKFGKTFEGFRPQGWVLVALWALLICLFFLWKRVENVSNYDRVQDGVLKEGEKNVGNPTEKCQEKQDKGSSNIISAEDTSEKSNLENHTNSSQSAASAFLPNTSEKYWGALILKPRSLFFVFGLVVIATIFFQTSTSVPLNKVTNPTEISQDDSAEEISKNLPRPAQQNNQFELELKFAGFYSKEAMNEAKTAIKETSEYSGWNESEILALITETNQYFKSHDYSPSMILSFTTETINLFHALGGSLYESDFNYMLYKLSGRKAAIRQAIQIEASLINTPEISSILIASMYKPSNDGFRYVPGINKDYLEETFNRMNGPLLDSGTLGNLNSIFNNYDRETQRHAHRAIGEYLRALSYKECQKLLAVLAKMRGYRSYQNCFEQKAYEFKLSPLVAHFLARVMVGYKSEGLAYIIGGPK